jgi:hypothetical protein
MRSLEKAKAAIRRSMVRILGADRTTLLRLAAGDFASAIAYRLSPTGRRSILSLDALRDTAKTRRCVIIGNGPSLNLMDLSPLAGEATFALNRGYLLFPRIGAPSTYLVSVNEFVVEQSGAEMLATPGPKFFSWRNRRHLPTQRGDIVFVRSVYRPGFSTDIARRGLWEGATVTFVALQLAYHIGYREVILVGVDHSFATAGPAHQLVTSTGADPNHFDPSYFGAGYKWQLPDLEMSEVAYALARRAFEAAGGRILDATVNGKLNVFDKVSFHETLTPAGNVG